MKRQRERVGQSREGETKRGIVSMSVVCVVVVIIINIVTRRWILTREAEAVILNSTL